MFDILLNVISPIFIIIFIAAFVGRVFKPDARTLSTLLIYVFLPALAFRGISQVELSADIAGIAIVAVGVQLAMIAIGLFLSRAFRFDRSTENAFILSVMLINAANYGIPFNTFAFGEEGGRFAILYWIVNTILGNTVGVFFASRGAAGVKQAILNTFKVPIIYATALGLLFNLSQIAVPLPLERSIDVLANASIPCMIVLLGLRLAQAKVTARWQPIALATGVRLIVSPLIAFGIAAALGMQGTAFKVAILESAMPTAVVASAFALQFGSDADFTSATTFVTTLASIATLTVFLTMLGGVTV